MAPAPKDASSLSFIATNQLRETLLTKNLPSPYEISDTLPVQFTDNSYRLSKQNEYFLSAPEIHMPYQVFHGAFPLSQSFSNCLLSRRVSIGCQKPLCLKAEN